MTLRVRDGRCACAGLHGGAGECDIASALRVLSGAYALDILDRLARAGAPMRFSALQGALDLAPNTLARRLRELDAGGVLERGDGRYRLTEAGARLWSGAQALAAWRG